MTYARETSFRSATRCREAFRKLLERCGFKGRMPRLIACGSRNAAFDDFKSALASPDPAQFIAMLIDSEDPLEDLEATWKHLETRDGWKKPSGAADEQVLFMATCMETWIVADLATLKKHYGKGPQPSALPPTAELERRGRHDVQERLAKATHNCSNAYARGRRSFEVVGELDPSALELHLPSFVRARAILASKL